MPLVDYASSPSDSESQGDVAREAQTQALPIAASTNSLKRKRPFGASHLQEDSAAKQPLDAGLPPLPPSFHDLYAFAARTTTQDDPALHGGRKRAVPHAHGNWPSHVYLEWQPSPAETKHLAQLVTTITSLLPQDLSGELHPLFESDLATPRPLHISLSQPLNLHTDQRNDFAEALVSSFQSPSARELRNKRPSDWNANRMQRRIAPFTTRLTTLDWASNDTGSRWFLVLRVAKSDGDALGQLLSACNRVAREFSQPELYAGRQTTNKSVTGTRHRDGHTQQSRSGNEGPQEDSTGQFHFSIAWMLQEPEADVTAKQLLALEAANEPVAKSLKEMRNIDLLFDAVKLKIGNEVISIALSDTAARGTKGILGK